MTVTHSGRRDLAIINRSFWPIYPVIGEALLRLLEDFSTSRKVSVIMQDRTDIYFELDSEHRGDKVEFFPAIAWSNSSSRVLIRAVDAIYFMFWVVFSLIRSRPRIVYVSTDPPVLIPFVVMLYARLFKAQFIYHLQDIHPEAASVVIKVNPLLFHILKWMDSATMRKADVLITITEEMAEQIRQRSGTKSTIYTINNPAISFTEVTHPPHKKKGFSFCGNAGRLQRIPLLVEAITQYLEAGGTLHFTFAGGGVHAPAISQLADRYPEVEYLGQITPADAAQLNCDYEWALLPIEDEVTRYAFPSKSSSYVFSGAAVLTICGSGTSVAEWISQHRLGIVCKPQIELLVDTFFEIEKGAISLSDYVGNRETLKAELSFEHFVTQLKNVINHQGHS